VAGEDDGRRNAKAKQMTLGPGEGRGRMGFVGLGRGARAGPNFRAVRVQSIDFGLSIKNDFGFSFDLFLSSPAEQNGKDFRFKERREENEDASEIGGARAESCGNRCQPREFPAFLLHGARAVRRRRCTRRLCTGAHTQAQPVGAAASARRHVPRAPSRDTPAPSTPPPTGD